jgi:hypothetical protein
VFFCKVFLKQHKPPTKEHIMSLSRREKKQKHLQLTEQEKELLREQRRLSKQRKREKNKGIYNLLSKRRNFLENKGDYQNKERKKKGEQKLKNLSKKK